MTEPSETTLLLIRHGEALANVGRFFGGEASCTGLSELGRRQAEALRDRWRAGQEPAATVLYSSTLPRAVETAEILQPALGDIPLVLERGFEELRPGDADGLRFDDLVDRFGPLDYRTRRHNAFAPNGESAEGFHHRTSLALEMVLTRHVGETIVVSCHGGVVDVAFRYLLDLPRRGNFDLHTLNTSITEFRADDSGDERGRWRLIRYNDHAHLAGLPPETTTSGDL